MAFHTGASLGGLEEIRARLASETQIELGQRASQEWRVEGGVLRNTVAPFFEIGGFLTPDGAEILLILQPETAIAGLLTARVDGVRHLLLNARCEPGLHGTAQFSTTIQSTPSNYLRRHGGGSTPFIDLFLGTGGRARVLHDSMQYDWGQYYDKKRKRFLLLEVDELLTAELPLVWVPEPVLHALMRQSFSVTSDLRSAMALLWAAGAAADGHPAAPADEPDEAVRQVGLHELHGWHVDEYGIRQTDGAQGVAVEFVRTSSPSREVGHWTQPLLRVAEPERVQLWTRHVEHGRQVALSRHGQVGLGGAQLYFPAEHSGEGVVLRSVSTSAEGGRFLRHRVDLAIMALPAGQSIDGATWIDEASLAPLLRTSETSAVELRLAASLLSDG